jgi:hypothetical protein
VGLLQLIPLFNRALVRRDPSGLWHGVIRSKPKVNVNMKANNDLNIILIY